MGKAVLLLTIVVLSLYSTEGFVLNPKGKEKPTDHAKVARALVHKANWVPFGTISTDPKLQGFPMVNVKSIADSARNAPSTGNIYIYLTELDFSGKDVKKDNKVTLLFSDESDLSCSKSNDDPMSPTCARVIMSGSVVELDEKSEEYKFARSSFHSRHPAADLWVQAHTFVLHKFEIQNIFVLDWFGGAHNITPEEYYQAKLE